MSCSASTRSTTTSPGRATSARSSAAYGNRIAQRALHARRLDRTSSPSTTARTICTAASEGFDKVVWQARAVRARRRHRRRLLLHERGRRRGLSRHADDPRHLHAHARQRARAATTARRPTSRRRSTSPITATSTWRDAARGDILQHQLTLDAIATRRSTRRMIPTGEIAAVAGTPFDFRTPTAIGARIDADDEQLRRGNGYDHNFVLDGWATAWRSELHPARRACVEPVERPHAGGRDHGARRAVLLRQQPRPRAQRLRPPRPPSASRRSTSPIRRTIRSSRRRSCGPADTYESTTVFTFGVTP